MTLVLQCFFVGNDRCGDLHENGYFPLPKCVVNVFLLEMRDRGDLTEEWAMIPVTKKHQNILPESQLVTKKHRRFFDVFSWQTENRGDVTKNSDFLLEKMVVHGQFFIYKVKAMCCILKLICHIQNRLSHGWSRHTNIFTKCKYLSYKTSPVKMFSSL